MRRIRARDLAAAGKVGLAVVIAAAVGLATFSIERRGTDVVAPMLAIGLVSLHLVTFRIGLPARAQRLARSAIDPMSSKRTVAAVAISEIRR